MAVLICDISFGATHPQIIKLMTEKKQKVAQLEQCAKKVTGFKIAGISTLGLTAVGVGGNIALASKNKKLDTEIENTQSSIEKEEKKLADINAKIAAARTEQNKVTNVTINNEQPVKTVNSDNGKFVLYCKEAALCEFQGGNIPQHQQSCSQDFDLTPGNPIFVKFDQPEECYKKLGAMQKHTGLCDYESYVFTTELDSNGHATAKGRSEGGYLFFCRGDGQIIRAYEASVSYDEKKCTSSYGKWNNGVCQCASKLVLTDGECLCPQGSEFKYPIKDPWTSSNAGPCDTWWLTSDEIAGSACYGTGGRLLTDGTCSCPSTMDLDKGKKYCNCKPGLKYIDPSRKSEGCGK